MRILVVDDDPTSRSMLSAMLRKAGHESIEVGNGADALDILRQQDAPRVAILDWMMPVMDGLEVIRRIREYQSDIPCYILMLTSRDEKADILEALSTGANDYLTKPFDICELRARVEAGCRTVTLQETLLGKINELHAALEQIQTLRGIIPVCANCKQVRDDQGYWRRVEEYITQHSEAECRHGLCPNCVDILYSDYLKAEIEVGSEPT